MEIYQDGNPITMSHSSNCVSQCGCDPCNTVSMCGCGTCNVEAKCGCTTS